MSEPTADRDPFEVVAESFLARFRAGQRPSIEDCAARHPELADQIRELLPALVMVEQDLTVDRPPGPAGPQAPRSPSPSREWRLGDYRILGEIGRGGMGVVYEAEQLSLGRRVALKVLPGHLAGDGTASERFRREAKAAARLHHTNIVPVFEVGRDGEVSYYAMQFIRGQGLDQIVEELRRLREPGRTPDGHEPAGSERREGAVTVVGPRVDDPSSPREHALARTTGMLLTGRLAAGRSGASGGGEDAESGSAMTEQIDFAATSGPRPDAPRLDVRPAPAAPGPSPSAVLPGGKHVSEVDTSGHRRPYFRSVAQIGRQAAQGLAYAHARGVVHRDIKPSNLLLDTEGVVWITDFGLAKADDDGLTASGDLLGTLRYMAPERFRGEGDARADVYALGLTLYELLTLRPAFDSTDRLRLIERIKNEQPARPRSIDPQIPRDLQTIVLKAIDKHPDHRYPSAEAIAEDLRRFLADEPIKARQISTSERYWRWARRNPTIAILGGVLTALLMLATIGSLLAAARFSALADRNEKMATSEKSARLRSDSLARSEAAARAEAEKARQAEAKEVRRAEAALLDSLDQTYRATRSEVRAMRLAHESGWRSAALERLGGLVRLGSRNLDRRELREEAMACLAEIDVRIGSRIAPLRDMGAWYLKFSPDGRTLAANDKSRGVSLWDLDRGRELDPIPKGLEFSPFAFHPGGSIAVATKPGRVTYHSLSPGQSSLPAIEGEGHALNLAFSRSGDRVAVAWGEVYLPASGSPRTLRRITVHETATGRVLRTIAIPAGSMVSYKVPLALSPDGEHVATTGPKFEVQVYPVGSQGDPIALGTLDTNVCTIAFQSDGRRLAACGKKFAAIWDLASRSERVRIIQPSDRGIWDLDFSPDGRYLATMSDDAIGRLWDARSGLELAAVPAQTGIGLSLAFSPRGDRFAVGATSVSILEIEGGRERRTESTTPSSSQDLVFDPVQPRLFFWGDHKLFDWSFDEAAARPEPLPTGQSESILRLAPGGREFVAGCQPYTGSPPDADYSVVIWSRDNHSARRLIGPRNAVDSIAVDEAGRRIAAGSRDGGFYLWDFRVGKLLYRKELGAMARSLEFLPEDGLLAVAGGRLLLLSAVDGAVRRELTLPGGATAFVVAPDRREALVAATDGTIYGVSLPGLAITRSRKSLDPDSWRRMTISPDGSLVAVTTQQECRALLLDLETLEPVATMPGRNSGPLYCLAIDPKSRYLAFGHATIALWDLALVRDELAPLGLAWGRAAPTATPSPNPAEASGRLDLAETGGEAIRLLQSGVAAFEQGRLADAVAELQQASDGFAALRRAHPADSSLVSRHAMGLGFLAGSLCGSKRPGEALARFRESLGVYELLDHPGPGDLYNMACGCAMVSALDGRSSPQDRQKLEARAVDYLRRAIASDTARIFPLVATDHDLDPLRRRPDFRDMMADASFPSDPFHHPEFR